MAADDQFGSAVAVSGETAVIGSILDDDNGNNSGAAYVFTVPTMPAPPIATANSYTIAEDTPLTGGNVISDDTGAGSDSGHGPLSVALGDDAGHGTLALSADGSFSYTPAANLGYFQFSSVIVQ